MNFWHINNLGQALRKVKETSLKRLHMSDSIYMTFWNVKLIVIETDEWLSGLRGRGRMVPREGRTREAQERPRAWLWCTLPRSVPWLCRWSNEPARVLTPRTARQMKCQFHSHNCNTKKISKELIIVMLNGKSVGRDHKGPDTLLGAASSRPPAAAAVLSNPFCPFRPRFSLALTSLHLAQFPCQKRGRWLYVCFISSALRKIKYFP